MAPVVLPDEGSFALKAFEKQSPNSEWRTKRQNSTLLFAVFFIICYSYLVYRVNKERRKAELQYQAEQRSSNKHRAAAVNNTNNSETGPSPAVPFSRPKAKHPLYGSITAIELPKPRDESVMTGHNQDVQPPRAPITTKSAMRRPAGILRSRTDHVPKPDAAVHRTSTRPSRTSELMIPYGTFEGSFHEVAPTKTKKVTFAEESSISSWSTVVSGEFKA